MARTIAEIQTDMLAKVQADSVLNPQLTSTSRTSIYRLWIYVVSVCMWTLEQIQDLFIADVIDIIANKNPHTARWYVNKVKEFQYGFALVPETDHYDNTGIDPDVVAASKIVAYAAFVELPFVRLKLAKLVGSDLAPLTNTERQAVVAYVMRFKDAGVRLNDTTITSTAADKLKLILRVKYNPLVLNASGERLDGTNLSPVKDAVKDYLQHLDFNGLFSIQKLVDRLQLVEGVSDLNVDSIQTQYGALPFTAVNISFIPDSGYVIIEDADLTITYQPA